MLNNEIKTAIDKSILCWLATCDKYNEPNVSPKELFTYIGDKTLLIAHLASPNSTNNIKDNPNVCVSFVDIFIQKGYKIKGVAKLIGKQDDDFSTKIKSLTDVFTDKFPIKAIIEIDIKKIELIQAPSYFLYPDTTEQSQIQCAMATYKVKPI